MSFPTVLSPWFVVQRLRDIDPINTDYVGMEYYTSMEDGGPTWTQNKHLAMLFMSLGSAARVANGEVAEVRVLTMKEEAKLFGRE